MIHRLLALLSLLPCALLPAGLALAAPPPVLRVVGDNNYPPFLFRDADGRVAGYVADWWRLWEQRTGVRVELNPIQWSAAQQTLLRGDAEVIDNLFRTPPREPLYDFTPPYADLPVGLYVHHAIAGIQDLAGLKGFRVGVMDGDACIDWLAQGGITDLRRFPDYSGLIQGALDGEVRLFCLDEYPANYYLYRQHAENSFYKAFDLYTGQFHRAVKKGNRELLNLVERGAAAITPEEDAALRERWLRQTEPDDLGHLILPWVGEILAGVVIVALALVGWNWRLAAEVARRRRAEERLQETGERLRTLNDNLPDSMIYQIDSGRFGKARRFTYVGANVEALHGVSAEAVLDDATLIYRQVAEEDQARLAAAEAHAAATMTPLRIEARCRLPGGEVRWRTFHSAPRRLENGHLVWDGIESDIQARKEAEAALAESELRFRQFAENTDAMFWVRTPDAMLYMSPAYETIFGRRCEEIYAQPDSFLDSVHPGDRQRVLDTIPHGRFDMVHRILRPDGEVRWIHARGRPVPDQPGLLTGIATDITERQQAEAELVQAREAAEAANRAKSAFLANMSHELRTPLNAILGFAQVMERDSDLPNGQRERVATMRRGGEHLLALISDVLDLAKVEAGRFDCTPREWETAPFFDQIHEMFRSRAESRGLFFEVRLTQALPPALRCDDIRLRQVLVNLLGNSVKFTEQGGITLSADYRDGRLYLDVVDSGVGMSAEELALAFDPFVQVGDAEKRRQGTGLGLAISRRLAEAMGGCLTVESEAGHGSHFFFDIPVELAARGAIPQPTTAAHEIVGYRRPGGEGALRLLVVDDLETNRGALRALLEPLGFKVIEAASGIECLERMAADPVDAVLLDLRMPHLSGQETARRLRAMPGGAALPIIAVSASAYREDARQAMAAGCNGHVAKPVILRELLDELGRHLPLEWLGRDDSPQAPSALPATKARPLSVEEHARLSEAARRGKIAELQRLAAKLAADDEPPRGAQELMEATRRFDLKRVRELLTAAGSGPVA